MARKNIWTVFKNMVLLNGTGVLTEYVKIMRDL